MSEQTICGGFLEVTHGFLLHLLENNLRKLTYFKCALEDEKRKGLEQGTRGKEKLFYAGWKSNQGRSSSQQEISKKNPVSPQRRGGETLTLIKEALWNVCNVLLND